MKSQPTPFSNSATGIASSVNRGDLDPRDVADFYIERTRKYAAELNCHTHWSEDLIGEQVDSLRRRLGREVLPLAGVPVLVKDNICTTGFRTTCGSRILGAYQSPFDATAVARLKAAGAIIFGKSNCDEFAMGSSNENSAFGPVLNPWNKRKVPGGSSGGSGAAVAADLVPVALGSDTGGSVRQPAGFCGIVGFKPTYGRISRYGLVAYGSSLDQIGPMTRTVADTALLTDVMSGHDREDSTSLPAGSTGALARISNVGNGSLSGVKIGIVSDFFGEGIANGVRKALDESRAALSASGATLIPVEIPSLSYAIAIYYLVATAEASANLARFDGIRYGARVADSGDSLADLYEKTRSAGFGKEVKQRIMLGTFALSAGYYDAYYGKALRARARLAADFGRAFESVDMLLTPTSPTTAFGLGEKTSDPLAMYLSDICTISANLAGVPAISVPCGLDDDGLPVGLQLMARRENDTNLLLWSHAIEQKLNWTGRYKPDGY